MKILVISLGLILNFSVFANSQFDYLYNLVKGMEGHYSGYYGLNNDQKCRLYFRLQNRFNYDALVSMTITREDSRSENLNLELIEFEDLLSGKDKISKLDSYHISFEDNSPSYIRFRYLRDSANLFLRNLSCANLKKD